MIEKNVKRIVLCVYFIPYAGKPSKRRKPQKPDKRKEIQEKRWFKD